MEFPIQRDENHLDTARRMGIPRGKHPIFHGPNRWSDRRLPFGPPRTGEKLEDMTDAELYRAEPMDIAFQLLKMSESEMMGYYHPETIVERYRERARRRGTRMRSGLADKIRQDAQLRAKRKKNAGIPSHLIHAHHNHPELLEARVQVSRAVAESSDMPGELRRHRGTRENLLPYEAHERNRIADLRDRASEWGIGMTPRAIYNNQRMSSQMIPEGFSMEDSEPDKIEPSGIPGMVFINGAGPVPDPRAVQTGEPMDLAWRLLKDRKSPEAWANKRRYDSQYEKTPKRVKYREQLNAERRRRGIYGKGGADVSHTQGGKLTLEKPSSNRARHFKGKGTLRRVKVR